MRLTYLLLLSLFSIAYSCEKSPDENGDENGNGNGGEVVAEMVSVSVKNQGIYNTTLGEITVEYSVPIKVTDDVKITLGSVPITVVANDKTLKISFESLLPITKYTLYIPDGSVVTVETEESFEDIAVTFSTKIMQLSVDGKYLVNSRGEKVVLKGVSYGWHNWEAEPLFNASTVKTLAKDWKCSVVRASMGVEPDGAYLTDPQLGIDCVTRVVDAAIEENIYVLIDWHSHGIYTEPAKKFFQQMASKYRGIPNVIYEIFNEPAHGSVYSGTDKKMYDWDAIKAYAIEVIKVIKAIDPDAVIAVGSPNWGQYVDKVAESPITGYSNILYTLHFYADSHKQSLRTRGDKAIKLNLPLFITECGGMNAQGEGSFNSVEWAAWLAWMEENSLSWVTWALNLKDETCSMLIPTASPNGNWPDSQLTDWGKIVKNELNKR